MNKIREALLELVREINDAIDHPEVQADGPKVIAAFKACRDRVQEVLNSIPEE